VQPIRKTFVPLRYQTGISNLQIMVGVLVGAIMITGGMAAIRQIEKAKVDNEVRELARLKKKGSALAAQRGGSFNGVSQQALVLLDFFPPEVLSGPATARTIRNQWGGALSITVSAAPNALNYRYTGVTSAACKQLGMAAANVAAGIQVQGTWIKAVATPGTFSNVDQANLGPICDRGADNVTMNFFLTM
jgi:PilS N terminal